MISPSRVVIPGLFYWLLLLEAPLVATTVYSSVYVFGVGTTPFILALIVANFHLLFGIYCCVTHAKPRPYHIYIVSPWLVVCTGVWCAILAYFACYLKEKPSDGANRPLLLRWTKAGCAISALGVALDLLLLGLFIFSLVKQKLQAQIPEPKSSDSKRLSTTPQLPPLPLFNPLQQHPLPQQPHHARADPPPRSPPLPEPQPPLASALATSNPPATDPTTPPNRIALLLSILSLQHPDGHFPPSPALAALLTQWAYGGGTTTTTNPSTATNVPPADPNTILISLTTPGGATALAHACLTDLSQQVWTARRAGREHAVLSAAELQSLEGGAGIGWGLGPAREGLARAAGWLGRWEHGAGGVR
ncbi:6d74ff38-0e17-4f52-aa18-6270440f0a92 [Thermothielavioides terrestris]|uniref:6d74ff38-0e17-4f52-aa18-6270440f0a92 n=1 Tax=Thermothielavioides terrestris TaxID=2587410 RepID=A0A446BMC9_9PEZI|nr:6d74ff38-0e17-4f52-aa18-6270440f0a92 [Thermothielavioides terrestris]